MYPTIGKGDQEMENLLKWFFTVLIVGIGPFALAATQSELNKTINVVGVDAGSGEAYVAVNSPGASAHPTCTFSILTIPLTQTGILQYETARDAKIGGSSVSIWFDDSDCEVDKLQVQ